MRSLRPLVVTILPTLVTFASMTGLAGCDLLGEDSAMLEVLSTHYASPADPDSEEAPGDAAIVTDLGWTIYLEDAVITTVGVTLSACDGGNHSVEMYWGAFPEDVTDGDLAVSGLGSVTVPVGEYCEVTVKYGPFEASGDADGYDTEIEDAVGASVYLKGVAIRDDQVVDFEWRTDRPIESEIDVTSIDGGRPLHVEENDVHATKITVAKTYDRFFDGVDFAAADSVDEAAILAGTLATQTRVHLGASVDPE